jgi:hypothetical protein
LRIFGVASFSLPLPPALTGLVTRLFEVDVEFEREELARRWAAGRARDDGSALGGGLANASFLTVALGVAEEVDAERVFELEPELGMREGVPAAIDPRGLIALVVAGGPIAPLTFRAEIEVRPELSELSGVELFLACFG